MQANEAILVEKAWIKIIIHIYIYINYSSKVNNTFMFLDFSDLVTSLYYT